MYESKEGDCDDDSRIKELSGYVAQHVRVGKDLRTKVEYSPRSKAAWNKCNKGGGSRRIMISERKAAVVRELSLREQEEADGARTLKASTGFERSTPVVLYLKQYAADFARIERELDAEDHGVTKPSRGEKLVLARAKAFERGDMVAVASVDATIAQRHATRRAARHRKKARKAAVAGQMRNYAFQSRTPDPFLVMNVRDHW